MSDLQASPISQLLHTLGITREDLEKRSDQMRQFLTAQDATTLRVLEGDGLRKPRSTSDLRSVLKAVGSTASSTRSRSRANSSSFRTITPPATPVKSEPVESLAPLRHFDSMEMVIERQRRQNKKEKKERRERERESQARINVPQLPSLSPNGAPQAGVNLDSFMQGRDAQRALSTGAQEELCSTTSQSEHITAPPVTPQRSRYYRDHTDTNGGIDAESHRTELATPTRASAPPVSQNNPPTQARPQYYAHPQHLTYGWLLPPFPAIHAEAGPSTLPVTPQPRRTYTFQRKSVNSPLPPSSPPPPSSPVSTPHRQVVNLVSSPGPMGPLPGEDEYDSLPYTLPPGPYSPSKPDLSLAALVGQAILSSPEHRLTLQEIYDWITIVYPYFKRGELTWMNSIRHVLSTTVCFRKVPRERSVGRSLWAIWDEDLECFKDGGFKKQFCKDIINGTTAKEKQAGLKGKGKGRKRADMDDGSDARKTKRSKKLHPAPLSALPIPSSYTSTPMSSLPLFPLTRPTPHHQPYYESCLHPPPLPGDVIFPPLPAGLEYSRVPVAVMSVSTPPAPLLSVPNILSGEDDECDDVLPPSSSLSSAPELTPDCSSSSPLPVDGQIERCAVTEPDAGNISHDFDDNLVALYSEEKSDSGVPEDTLLTAKPKNMLLSGTLRSSIKFSVADILYSDENEESEERHLKSGKNSQRKKANKGMFPPIPTSPTLNRRLSSRPDMPKAVMDKKLGEDRLMTPTPSTPPRGSCQLPTSSIRTPLASKGVNPAALQSECDEDYCDTGEQDKSKTPRRRVSNSGAVIPAPVTPRRLVFPTNQNDSPYRTPIGVFGTSPFRTPGSRAVFDPHDPGALLDEELSRMGTVGHEDSPTGLFGKGRGSLLYDSPGLLTSPGQLHRWW